MTNNEKIFKLLGWKISFEHGWGKPGGKRYTHLPDVSNDYELCRKHIIPEMSIKGYEWTADYDDGLKVINWWDFLKDDPLVSVEIKDDNIAAALVEAAIKVLEGEK